MKFAQLTIAAALALALAGCNTSYNYFQDDVAKRDTSGEDTTLFGTMLTMSGVIPRQQETINYKPRAPIAVPGTSALPAPGSGTPSAISANFPEDQDSAEARRRAEIQNTLAGPNYAGDGVRENSDAQLTPEEIQAGRRAGGGLRQPTQLFTNPFGDRSANLNREKMKVVVRAPRAGGEVLTGEGKAAPRKYLIQPPDAYRTPAETAALPDKKEIENSEWAKKQLYNIKDKTPRRLQE